VAEDAIVALVSSKDSVNAAPQVAVVDGAANANLLRKLGASVSKEASQDASLVLDGVALSRNFLVEAGLAEPQPVSRKTVGAIATAMLAPAQGSILQRQTRQGLS
jgi:hypothetical protein